MGIFNDIAESTGGGTGGGTGTGLRGLTGVSVDDISLTDNNDGSIALNFSMSNGSIIGPISASLVSDSLIALNKISLEGINYTDKLFIKDFDENIVFNVNSLDNVVTITEINNEDVNKLKLDNMDGVTEANKFVLTNSNNSFYVGGLTGSYIGPSGIELKGEDGLSIRGTNNSSKFIIRNEDNIEIFRVSTASDNTTFINNIDNVDVNKLKITENGFADPNKAIITNNFNTFQLKFNPNDAFGSFFSPEGISVGGADGIEIDGYNSSSKFVVKDYDGNSFLKVNTFTGETDITLLRNEVYANSASTGVVSGGILSIGTPNTTFSISNGRGYIVDTEVSSPITWTGLSNIAVTNIGVQLITYVLIGSGGVVFQQATRPTAQERRFKIFLGVVVHVNKLFVDAVNNQQVHTKHPGSQVYDVLGALGFLNIEGNTISAFSTNLTIQKAAGKILASGSNYSTDELNPHVLSLASKIPATFQYLMRNGFNYTGINTQSDIITNLYDVGTDTPAIMPNNSWAVQRVYLFTSNNIKIQFGQFTYPTKADAISALNSENFIVETGVLNNGLYIGYIVVRKDATNLSDASTAQFVSIGKFGNISSASSSNTTLQSAYNLSEANPEILTNSTQGGLNIKRGSALDTDLVLSVQNGAGTTVSSMSGEGVLTANKVIFKKYHHLPAWNMSDYDKNDVSQYFLRKCQPNAPVKTFQITTGGPAAGGLSVCYAPFLRRYYIGPDAHSNQANWWYWDCKTQAFVSYAHGITGLSAGAYRCFTYHAGLNRIYMIPHIIGTTWHYIDGLTGAVVSYTGASVVGGAYSFGVYSPIEKRIYCIPTSQATQTNYHYIDSTGAVVTYVSTIKSQASYDASYDPVNNRIMIAPHENASQPSWYYIDCAIGVADVSKVKSYLHGQTGVANTATYGAVYHPILRRVYFIPWSGLGYFWDCDTLTISSFNTGGVSGAAYINAFLMPTLGSIILVPYNRGTTDTWKMVDYQGTVTDLLDTTGTWNAVLKTGFYDVENDIAFMLADSITDYIKLEPLTIEKIDRFAMVIMDN